MRTASCTGVVGRGPWSCARACDRPSLPLVPRPGVPACGGPTSEPQPTTVSHDGGCTDRSRARTPRYTPTGLSHAAGAVDQSKTQRLARDIGAGAISLGSCGHLGLVLALTWADGRGVVPSGLAAFPVIPRCSPLYLVRLWCTGVVSDCPYAAECWVGLLSR